MARKLKFVCEIPLVQNYRYCQIKTIEYKLYLHKSESSTNTTVLYQHQSNWPFLDKYSPTKGLSVRVFKFHLKDLTNPLKNLLEPSQDLINTEFREEETTTVTTTHDFNPNYKGIDDNVKNYKNTPITYYIRKSYFLYDKSDLIKDTFITALNIKISIYSSISYFNKKSENEIFRIVSPKELLKFSCR